MSVGGMFFDQKAWSRLDRDELEPKHVSLVNSLNKSFLLHFFFNFILFLGRFHSANHIGSTFQQFHSSLFLVAKGGYELVSS
jgi:hypothetical protein